MTDNKKIKKYINIAKGQLDGIAKMLDDGRDNLEIADQLMATRSILKKTNNIILENSIENGIEMATKYGKNDRIKEIMKALEKQI